MTIRTFSCSFSDFLLGLRKKIYMKKPEWKTTSREVFFKTPWNTFMHDEFVMENGKRGNYWYVHSAGSVFVVPITLEKKIIMTHQFRYLVDRMCYEFPGGGVPEGMDIVEAARMELKQEIGIEAEQLISVGEFIPMNGVTNELCHVYVAMGLKDSGQQLEETERINVVSFSIDEFEQMIRDKKIDDGMTLAAWSLAKYHL